MSSEANENGAEPIGDDFRPRKPAHDRRFLSQRLKIVERPLARIGSPKRILLSHGCGTGLGDQFMFIPLYRAVRSAYARCRIDLLTDRSEFWEGVIEGGTSIVAFGFGCSETILNLLDRDYGLILAGYHPRCIEALGRSRQTTVFTSSHDLAKARCFFTHGGAVREVRLTKTSQAVSEQHKFLALLDDIGLCDSSPPQPTSVADGHAQFDMLRSRMPSSLSALRILLHPCSAGAYKNWPVEAWCALVSQLARKGMDVAVSAGTSELECKIAESICKAVKGARPLPQMPLASIQRTVADSHVVLSPDTFVAHAAHFAGSSLSLSIFGRTDPLRYCPNGLCSFFLYPFSVTPTHYADSVEVLYRLFCSQTVSEIELVVGSAFCDRLWRMMDDLEHLKTPDIDSNELCLRVALSLLECRTLVAERARALVLGHDDLVRALIRALDSEHVPKIIQLLEQSPLLRCGRVMRFLHRSR